MKKPVYKPRFLFKVAIFFAVLFMAYLSIRYLVEADLHKWSYAVGIFLIVFWIIGVEGGGLIEIMIWFVTMVANGKDIQSIPGFGLLFYKDTPMIKREAADDKGGDR